MPEKLKQFIDTLSFEELDAIFLWLDGTHTSSWQLSEVCAIRMKLLDENRYKELFGND